MTRKTFLSALLASTALFLSGVPANAQGACLSSQQIQSAVASGSILPLNEILARSGIPPNTVLSPVRVCDQGGQPYYQIPVDEGGQARTIALNAITGQP